MALDATPKGPPGEIGDMEDKGLEGLKPSPEVGREEDGPGRMGKAFKDGLGDKIGGGTGACGKAVK